ncbi:hypothetical protein FB561_2585 [Kribbella amoyensis]|uniref:Uncharacterized protein n=1 Tax=Kribbella amoyensis TaxID=996641 RepID=A0A561BRJ3_9ACTN|nr:hypothetical protein FB561_2585 [Kribbella amoyensis]
MTIHRLMAALAGEQGTVRGEDEPAATPTDDRYDAAAEH